MQNIEQTAKAIQQMKKLLTKDSIRQPKKLWKNTYIKKQIVKRENGSAFTMNDHIRAMVYSMLSSGASWKRLEPSIDIKTGRILLVDEIFYQYDVDTLLHTDPMDLVKKVLEHKLGTPYIKNQIHALIDVNIGKLQWLEKEYGSIDHFYQEYIDVDSSLKSLVKTLSAAGSPHKFAQLGEALTAEYLKNVGYDIAKPDRHIRRILGSDYLACSEKKNVPVYEAFDIVAAIAKEANQSIAEADYILWSYCANGYGVCMTRNPKCEQCAITQYCKKY